MVQASVPAALVYDGPMAQPVPSLEPRQAAASDPVPFQGWRIVALAGVCHALGFGLLGVYAFMISPLIEEFGATPLQLGLGMSIMTFFTALAGAALGPLLDRGPLRAIMLCGLGVMLTGVLLLTRAGSLSALAAFFAMVTVGMGMYGMFPAQVMLVNWYIAGRGKALAIAAVGISVSAFAVPLITSRLIAALGWRDALIALALGAAAIAAPLIARFAIKRPEEVGQHPDGVLRPAREGGPATLLVEIPLAALVRDPAFWLIGLGTGLAFCASLPGFFLVRHMESELGIPTVQAAYVPAAQGIAGLIGKLVAGWAIDRIDKRAVVIAALCLHALGWIIAVNQSSLAGMLAAAIPLGLGGGGFLPLPPVLQGACFGRAMIGRVAGLHALLAFPFLLGITPFAGWLQAQTGSFVQPFLGLAGTCLLAALVLGLVRIPKVEPGL
jgi:MFS family permease